LASTSHWQKQRYGHDPIPGSLLLACLALKSLRVTNFRQPRHKHKLLSLSGVPWPKKVVTIRFVMVFSGVALGELVVLAMHGRCPSRRLSRA
jgi:hypothetical protein